MKISYDWLKEYLDFDLTPEETADNLTLAGLEVEDVEHIGSKLEGVVIGKVLTCEKHPNADRLNLCTVDVGSDTLQIVCGAPNVSAGQTVPVAKVGTELPLVLDNGKNLVLKKAKIRGQTSEGMICAEDELGLSDNHEGIMVLDDHIEAGTPFSEIRDTFEDYVFEIGLTPNRPDASCHIGVARDLAAILRKPLKRSKNETKYDERNLDDLISIEIRNPKKCHRYVAKIIKNVTIKESPQWLRNRLLSIGLRPINNVVDATNFVLHEMGQPLHAFDYDQVSDKKIIVQSFDKPVKFRTLDDVERTIPADSLFICDGQKPVALAGIMGGQNSEINNNTQTVLLESAYFEPTGIRKTSRLQALQTDASYRFERGIDPNITIEAANRCANLIASLADGTIVDGSTDIHPIVTEPINLKLRISFLNKLLGTNISTAEAEEILTALEIKVKNNYKDVLECKIPTFRPDIEREVDLIEEVARIYNYERIPKPELVQYVSPAPIPFHETFLNSIRDAVKSLGFKEIYTNSLLPENAGVQLGLDDVDVVIPTINPISKDQAIMRPSLAYGFLKSVAYNFNRTAQSIRFFETGHVFEKSSEGTYHKGIKEETNLLLGISGIKSKEHWSEESRPYTFFDLKSAADALFKILGLSEKISYQSEFPATLDLLLKNKKIGSIYKVHKKLLKTFEIEQDTFILELSLNEPELFMKQQLKSKVYNEISKYPPFDYDIALVTDRATSAGELMGTIEKAAGSALQSVDIFDVYEDQSIGKGKKSIAFRLTFLDKTKTLTISSVEPIIKRVLKQLDKDHSAKLRS